jgi:hypothetical protein
MMFGRAIIRGKRLELVAYVRLQFGQEFRENKCQVG